MCRGGEPVQEVDVFSLIHDGDIYEGFSHEQYEKDLQGWGGHKEFFTRMIEWTTPSLIIEVGTWKGKSACVMAQILKTFPDLRDSKVLCIDTWLGATEFWRDHSSEKRYKSLGRKAGYPQVYYQFLANVVKTGNADSIIPFPQTSSNAFRLLKERNVKADLIYIDGSHEFEDVLADLAKYSELLTDDGIIFGDDYCEYWPGVKQAVDMFKNIHGLTFQHKRYENKKDEAPSDYWVLSNGGVSL